MLRLVHLVRRTPCLALRLAAVPAVRTARVGFVASLSVFL
jgi:hypothetical protein